MQDKPSSPLSIGTASTIELSGGADVTSEKNPFADISIDENENHLISKVAGLLVVARNSTFTFKNTAVDVRKAAADLGVRYVVEGSVRRAAR